MGTPTRHPLDDVDPDEFFARYDARARERNSRRHEPAPLHKAPGGRVLLAVAGALLLGTVVGLIALWPHGHAVPKTQQALGGRSLGARVVAAADVPCPGPAPQACRRIRVRLDDGRDKGRAFPVTLGPSRFSPKVASGDRIRVDAVTGAPAGSERYAFADFDRRGSLLWLAIAVAVLACALIRWRGALALAGVVLSLLLVTKFVVPAILDGSSATAVALVGALAVMFVTLVMTNGIGVQTLAAALGIGSTLLLSAGLATLAVHMVRLDGLSSDLATVLRQQDGSLSLQGVVLAGMVIGALGALTDMAVSQASAVMALRRANANLSARQLYRGAFTVGRDHLSATIHTLVLAYAGAALPLLLVLQKAGVGFTDALNSQDIAEPLTATLVGAACLIAAVPLTTALAATLALRLPASSLPAHGHAHQL